jgi:hypothetical protein
MAAPKRLPEPLHFKAGAEQREQASHEGHAALGHQKEVDARIEFGKMSEYDNAEQGAAEDETELTQKNRNRCCRNEFG